MTDVTSQRCQAINDHGQRCRSRRDIVAVRYWGDRSTNGWQAVQWVEVRLCKQHRSPK